MLTAFYNKWAVLSAWPGVVGNGLLIIVCSESFIAFVLFTICQKELLLLCQHWVYCKDQTFQTHTHRTGVHPVCQHCHKTNITCIIHNTLHEASTLVLILGCPLFIMTCGSFSVTFLSILSHSFSTSNLEIKKDTE